MAVALAGVVWASPQAMAEQPLDPPRSIERGHAEAIRRFIASINDHRIGDALAMMGPEMVPNARARAGWTRQFSAISSIRVLAIRPSDIGGGPCSTYKVTLEARLSARAANGPIPRYGWGDNPNFRWIELCPGAGRSWRISSFGTGP
jgi:hypothetical protein